MALSEVTLESACGDGRLCGNVPFISLGRTVASTDSEQHTLQAEALCLAPGAQLSECPAYLTSLTAPVDSGARCSPKLRVALKLCVH